MPLLRLLLRLLLAQPFREFLRSDHVKKSPHPVMRKPAELRARELVGAETRWKEHHLRRHARYGVLLYTEIRQEEAVDDVLRVQPEVDGASNRHRDLVEADDVILPGRVGGIESQRILRVVHELRTGAAEDAVRTGISHVPHELLRGYLNLGRV